MHDFLTFFDYLVHRFQMHLEIRYNKTCDWEIYIYKRGCAKDYPDAEHYGDDIVIVDVQSCDMALCFAMAHVELKKWMLAYNDGY